jgi:hypothetical protein
MLLSIVLGAFARATGWAKISVEMIIFALKILLTDIKL